MSTVQVRLCDSSLWYIYHKHSRHRCTLPETGVPQSHWNTKMLKQRSDNPFLTKNPNVVYCLWTVSIMSGTVPKWDVPVLASIWRYHKMCSSNSFILDPGINMVKMSARLVCIPPSLATFIFPVAIASQTLWKESLQHASSSSGSILATNLLPLQSCRRKVHIHQWL